MNKGRFFDLGISVTPVFETLSSEEKSLINQISYLLPDLANGGKLKRIGDDIVGRPVYEVIYRENPVAIKLEFTLRISQRSPIKPVIMAIEIQRKSGDA